MVSCARKQCRVKMNTVESRRGACACLWIVFFFFSLTPDLTQGYEPPELIPTDDQIVIPSNGNFTLRCEGQRPIEWVYPTYDDDEVSLINITSIVESGSIYPYVSHLTIINAYYLDTGDYYCKYKNASLDDTRNVAMIYVFVSDSMNLLAINDSVLFIIGNQYTDVDIPCKPTSPDVNVTLYRDSEIVKVPTDYASYDPKKGYSLRFIDINDGGTYECKASYNGFDHSEYMILTVLPHTDSINEPSINDSQARNVVVGGNITLTCEVTTLPGVMFDLNWHIPNKGRAQSEYEIGNSTSRTSVTRGVEYKHGSRHLIIPNATMSDRGYYNCTVEDALKNKNIRKVFVEVHDTNTSYINFTVEGEAYKIQVKHGKDYVRWVVLVNAHPAPQLVWFDPEGYEITNSKKYDVKVEAKQTILIINNIQMKDAGQYKLKAVNKIEEKELNLTLEVEDTPSVRILSDEYYYYKRKHKVECEAIGYPIPTIQWEFKKCMKYPDCEGDFQSIQEDWYKETVYKYQIKSVLEIEATHTGFLSCMACNKLGCENETVQFLVADIDNGFGISGISDPVEGDNVSLICRASFYNYTDQLNWFKMPGLKLIARSQPPLSIMKTRTKFSYENRLFIKNISQKYSGQYLCGARDNIIEDFYNKSINIVVRAIEAPKFLKSNLNNSELFVELEYQLKWTCYAHGVPSPSIIWYKDDKVFDISNGTRVELLDGNQTLIIKYTKASDTGIYKCIVENRGGKVSKYVSLSVNDGSENSQYGLIAAVVCAVFSLFGAIMATCWIIRYKRMKREFTCEELEHFEQGAIDSINPDLCVDDQAELLPYDKKWEFPREHLKLGKQLGSGAFGRVLKAEAMGIAEGEALSIVAVKMVKPHADYTYVKALMTELKIMIHLGRHLNVVNLLGACTKNLKKRELLVIVEFCRFGNLQNYLLRHRDEFIDQVDPETGKINPNLGAEMMDEANSSVAKAREAAIEERRIKYAALAFSSGSSGGRSDAIDYRAVTDSGSNCNSGTVQLINTDMSTLSFSPSGEDSGSSVPGASQPEWRTNYRGDYRGTDIRPICTRDLLCWAFQVARGMEYLASRKVLHGDLAARNILLADDNVVKICDFGLAKDMYKSDNYLRKGNGPLPIKWMAIESIRDRIFSTQSDVWSFGVVLWELFSLGQTPYPGMDADEIFYGKLLDGYRMEKPKYTTSDLYKIMNDCWRSQPGRRPTFTDLAETLGDMLEETVRKHYVDLNDPYLQMNDRWKQERSDYLSMMSDPSYLNATRKQTPQRDYVNLPSTSTDYLTMNSPLPQTASDEQPHYQNISPHENMEPVTDASGYLCMRSPVKSKPNPSTKFSFDLDNLNPQLRPAETTGADTMETEPMIRRSDDNNAKPQGLTLKTNLDDFRRSRLDSGISSPSFFNPSYQSLMVLDKQHDYLNTPKITEDNEKGNHLSLESDSSSGFHSDGGEYPKMRTMPQFVDSPPPPYVIATTLDPILI